MELKDKAEGRRYYFNLWLNYDEDWAKVEIAERVIHTKSTRTYGESKWLMLHKLEKLHPPVICKAIWDAKLADTSQWRPHPDIPEVLEAIQVRVPVEDGEEWDEEQKHASETSLTADVSKEAGKTLLPSRIGSNLGSPSASSLSPPAPPPAQVPPAAVPLQDDVAAAAAAEAAAEATASKEKDKLSPQEAAFRDREAAKVAQFKKNMADMEERKNARAQDSEVKRRAAEATREAAKEAAAQRKDSVEGKAEKWALGLSKELAAGKGEIKAAKSSGTRDAKTAALIKLCEEHCKTLEKMREQLEKPALGDKAKENLIREAPDALKEFKRQRKMLTPK